MQRDHERYLAVLFEQSAMSASTRTTPASASFSRAPGDGLNVAIEPAQNDAGMPNRLPRSGSALASGCR